MDRPSKEAVDRAVEHYYDDSICAIERSCAEILAAEVLALREELEAAPRCKTCKHWSVTDPYWLANIDSEHAWGHCAELKASSNFEADVYGDGWLRGYDTGATFGCVEYEAKP